MALPIGITSAGLQIPSVDDIIDDISEDVRAKFGAEVDTNAATPLGEFIEIFADIAVQICELVEAAYNAQNPDAATATALEQICALTGTFRNPATKGTVTLTLTGTPATVVASGSRAANAAGTQFASTAPGTIAALTAWAGSTGYALGARRTNSSRCYVVITAGTSAGSGGPTTTDADITDGTVHWRYLGDGTGAVDVPAEAVETGPLGSVSGTITSIVTPVGGWSSVINLLDVTPGTDTESDGALRERRETDLANAGTSPVDAIRADLQRVAGVTNVIVFANDTDATVDGMPPHSVEALVQGGVDQDIRDQLLKSVAGGIQTHGTTSGSATDDAGNVHTIKFTRPTLVDIYLDVIVMKDVTLYPLDGDTQVRDAILAYGNSLPVGRDAVSRALGSRAFSVPGVLDAVVLLDDAPSPPDTDPVTIGSRELASYDSSRINVSSNPATP